MVIGNHGEIVTRGAVAPQIPAPVEGQTVPVVRASHKRLYRQAFGAFCMSFGLLAYVLGQVSAPALALFPALRWLPLLFVAVAAFWQGLQHIAAALHIQIVSFNTPLPQLPDAPQTEPTDAAPASAPPPPSGP